MENGSERGRQANDGDIRTAESTTARSARCPVRRGLTIPGAFARAAIVAGLFVQSVHASAAGLDAGESPAIVPPTPARPAGGREQVRVQPRAWEFAPPYGIPDLPPERARIVDQLYEELMRSTPSAGKESLAKRSSFARPDR
jgi:hypothetical protein